MKYYHYLFVATLALSANAHALQPKIEIFEQFDDLRMIAFISADDINNSPEWNPDLTPPSLTVYNAIKAVKKFRKKPTAVQEIEIRPVPGYEKHWHYLIKVSNDAMKSKHDIYIVLMDGKIIPATIEPEGYK
ncbi:MAG TPA: hypothetical protein ENJ08_14000 [Gammaproteobacteria bacterium]|nr:hypothetical protein [Gammaproteobacteria bacterium]